MSLVLARLAGAYFRASGLHIPKVSRMYTFGQPRIGLHDFCDSYSQILGGKLVRFVNKEDVVPRVPLTGLIEYGDTGTMIHFDSAGKPLRQSPEWQSFSGRALQDLKDLAEMLGNLKVDVGEHSLTGFRELVESRQAELGQLLS